MNYEIIPDSELNTNTLLNSNKVLFSESEIKSFKRTPWTWYTITENSPENIWQSIKENNYSQKDIEFLIDIGYTAFSEIITIDNTLKKAINIRQNNTDAKDLNINDLKITSKFQHIDNMSTFLGMPKIITNTDINKLEIKEKETIDIVFAYKLRGWEISQMCYDTIELLDIHKKEIMPIQLIISKKDKDKFSEISKFAEKIGAKKAFLKGSYVKYIESEKKSKIPSDIDLSIIIDDLVSSKYTQIINDKSHVNEIEIFPLIIPYEYSNAHTFFDLDINQNSKMIYDNPTNQQTRNNLKIIKNPEKIIRVIGNLGINDIRKLAMDKEKIIDLCKSPHAYRKIYSNIRRPEMFYKRLKENNIEYLVNEPPATSLEFNKDMPIIEIQKILINSSITLSEMNKHVEEYITSK